MAFKIYSEYDAIKTDVLMAVIYGIPGIGKTSLSFTSHSPVLLDFDRGAQRSIGQKTVIRIDRWEDMIDLQKSPEFVKLSPKTLVLDTGGTMLDNYIAEYVKRADPKNARRGGELTLQGYGAMKNIFKQFKDWASSIQCNIIFICHSKDENENDNVKKIPMVTGGSLDILRQGADLIGYMSANQNKRIIDFRASIDSHEGKDCAGIGVVEIPDYKTPEYANFFSGIIDRTLSRMNEINEKQKEAISKVSEYKDKISKVKNPAGANKIIADLSGEEKHIQVQCFLYLKEAVKSFALYDSQNKKFVKNEVVQSQSDPS